MFYFVYNSCRQCTTLSSLTIFIVIAVINLFMEKMKISVAARVSRILSDR